MQYALLALETVALMAVQVLAGFLFARFLKLTDDQYSLMGRLPIVVAFPCMIYHYTVHKLDLGRMADDALYILLMVAATVLCLLLSYGVARLIKTGKNHRGLFVAMAAMPNSLLFGSTISLGIFGDSAMPYVIYAFLINSLCFWTLGLYLVQSSAGTQSKLISLRSLKQLITTPTIVAFIIGLAVALIGIRLPGPVDRAIEGLGNLSLPVGMMYIGMTLYRTGFKLKLDRDLAAISVMRFILSPLIMFLLLRPANPPLMPLMVCVLQMSMPVMTQVSIVAALEGADVPYVTRATVVTTLLCLVATPVITYLVPLF